MNFVQQVAQDTAVKVDVGIAGAALSSSWWLPHFDTAIHILLGVTGVAIVLSRLAIMWLQYRNSKRVK